MGFFDDPGNQAQPQDTSGRSTAGTILSMLGGVTGSGVLSGLGGMFNNEARLKFLDAQRPRLLKLARDEGIIDQKKADFLQQMPLEAAMPDLHDINQQIFAKKQSSGSLMDWYRQEHGASATPEGYEAMITKAKGSSQKPFIPNPVNARAMQLLGTNDPAVLAQHPEAIAAAQQEQFDRQKQEQANIQRQSREDYYRFAQSFKPTAAQKAAEAAAMTSARLGATNAFIQQKPFGQVDKNNVPFIETADGKEVPVPTTLPYGKIANHPRVFYVPKGAVNNGTYMRLNALPDTGQQLVAAAPGALGAKGGIYGAIGKGAKFLKGDPAYSQYKTAGASYVDTVASAFSRRVSDPLIRRWQDGIYGTFATPESVQAAVAEINKTAASMKQSLRTKAASDVGASAGDMLDKLGASSSSAGEGAGDEAMPPPPPMLTGAPPPPAGYE